jgi:uncharacterized protein YyaL (SSP411 family)
LKYYTQRFDPTNGGFGTAPKFPTPVNLGFLLQLAKLKPELLGKDDILAAEQMVMNTLQKMALGGIHGMPFQLTADDRSYRSWLCEI